MFTFIGKTLVILFGTLSILCLMGAVAVHTQKMDYVTPRGGEAGKKTFNRIEKAQARAKELLAANQRAVTRLAVEMEPLVKHEMDYELRRDYYAAQIELLKTGKWYGKDVATPVQQLPKMDKEGLFEIHTDKTKAPAQKAIEVFGKGQLSAARPVNEYREELQQINTNITNTMKAIEKLEAAHAESTLVINGSEEPGKVRKGLRTRIKEQIQIKEDAIAETEFLEDYVSRRQAEAELFVKRRDALIDRLEELKKFFKIKDPALPGS